MQAFVTALRSKDGAAARPKLQALTAEAFASAQAGAPSGARARVLLPPAILNACASLLEEGSQTGSMILEILKEVNMAASIGGCDYPGIEILGHARFAR